MYVHKGSSYLSVARPACYVIRINISKFCEYPRCIVIRYTATLVYRYFCLVQSVQFNNEGTLFTNFFSLLSTNVMHQLIVLQHLNIFAKHGL